MRSAQPLALWRPGPPGVTPLVRDDARSYGDPQSENVLVHAENLDGMRRLARAGFVELFRCIYFDPPYNSGRRFAEYDDVLEPEQWRIMMRERLAAARDLLSQDGAIFVEIDDTELGPLLIEMDEVFGREQRVSTTTVIRSAATGHKAINRGPVNVTDFLLVYAKERTRWRANALTRERAGYDAAYGTWLENPDESLDRWRFVSLASHVRRKLGRDVTRSAIEQYAIAHVEHVVRFAQPRYEAISRDARALIDQSRCEPDRVMRLAREGRSDFIVRAGNRVLFLKDKVVDRGGRRVLVEPLTNVWDDVPFQGDRQGRRRSIRP